MKHIIIYAILISTLSCFNKPVNTEASKEIEALIEYLDTLDTYGDDRLTIYKDSLIRVVMDVKLKLNNSELDNLELVSIFEDLRKKTKNIHYLARILKAENSSLKDSIDYKDSINTVQMVQIISAAQRQKTMQSAIREYSQLKIINYSVVPMRFKKGLLKDVWIEETKASKVNALRIDFSIQKNSLALRGIKVVTVVVESLVNRAERSISKEVIFDGNETPVTMQYRPIEPFVKGERVVKIIIQAEDKKIMMLKLD